MQTGRKSRAGFTLIELMIVMAIVVILIATAIPQYQKSLIRAKESVLKNNLFTIRMMLDEYSYDKQKAPQTLDDLVSDGYLRQVPIDPMTGNRDWKVVMEEGTNTVNQSEPGILSVCSASDKTSSQGDPYSDCDNW